MTENKKRSSAKCGDACKYFTCGYCRESLPVDPCDRSAFDNYPLCCGSDGEGHAKKQKACKSFRCFFKDEDGSCRVTS